MILFLLKKTFLWQETQNHAKVLLFFLTTEHLTLKILKSNLNCFKLLVRLFKPIYSICRLVLELTYDFIFI